MYMKKLSKKAVRYSNNDALKVVVFNSKTVNLKSLAILTSHVKPVYKILDNLSVVFFLSKFLHYGLFCAIKDYSCA